MGLLLPTKLPVLLGRNPLPYQGQLTLSGGVITDATRLTGTQGDGVAYPDSSVGVWPAATNLVENSGFETDTNGLANDSNASRARTTTRSKFGVASATITSLAAGNWSVVVLKADNVTRMSVTGGAAYTFSVWLYSSAGARLHRLQILHFDGGGSIVETTIGTSTAVSAGVWTRLTLTITANASAVTIRPLIVGESAAAAGETFEIDGVQFETGSIATPYIHTDGGTASRSAGRIQIPNVNTLITPTNFGFALRFKTGWAASGPGYFPRQFTWADDANNIIEVVWDTGLKYFYLVRRNTSGNCVVTGNTMVSLASGDNVLVVVQGDSSKIQLSVNGETLLTNSGTQYTPTLSATSADIGSRGTITAARELAGIVYWAACWRGLLSNGEVAALYAQGNNRLLPHQFPKSADLRFLAHFYGDGSAYRYRAA